MLKKMSLVVLCMVLGVCLMTLASSVRAEDAQQKITGKIIDVDLDEKSLVIGASEKDMVVYIEDDTQIQQGSEKKLIGDLTVGNIVEINCTKSGDDLLAQSISII